MDFRLNAEQEMMRDGAQRFVADKLDFAVRVGRQSGSGDEWAAMAELGWLMLHVSEHRGGIGGGMEEAAIIAEALGRGLAVEPFIEAAILPARLIELGDPGGAHAALLTLLITGEAKFAAALYEPGRGFSLAPQCVRAARVAEGYTLTGQKLLVWGGAEADWLLVSAALDGDCALFVVPADSCGVTKRVYQSIDGRSLADFEFSKVKLNPTSRLLPEGDTALVIEEATDETILALCSDILGCMDRAIELTVMYLKIRQQFGQQLAKFQVLQHGVANLFIAANDARSLLYRGLSSLGGPTSARRLAVSACKFRILETARLVTGNAVHFHGGIGVTTEYAVGHHLRRVLVAEQMFGNGAYHFERYLQESSQIRDKNP